MTSKLLLVLAALLSHLEPAAADLLDLGRQGVTEPAEAREPVASVQVDLLPDHESAQLLAAAIRERLVAAGLEHPVIVEIIPGEPELPVSYRVVVGPFYEFEDAERARTELDGVGVDGFVREFEPLIGC